MAERLTARTKEGCPYLANVKDDEQEVECKSRNTAQCIMDSWERLAAYEDLGTVEELAELVSAKRDGRCVVLPKTGIGDFSDGYHTFNELYHHRAVLFSVICNEHPNKAWKSIKHDTGDMFDGMFIVGIETPEGQATYHYDVVPYWEMFKVKELPKAPKWDGHTPTQAIERIKNFTREEAAAAALKESPNGTP